MVEGQEGPSWDDWLALAEACEQHGLEALFRSDHYLSQTDPERAATDAWTLIGALAARTSKLRLGTLVSPVTFRHPAVVAKAAATADQISGGRIEVGMGAGWMADGARALRLRLSGDEGAGANAGRARRAGRPAPAGGPAHRPAAPSAADRRRQRGPRDGRPGRAVRRRVQHLRRRRGRGRPAAEEARRGMRARGPRSGVAALLPDDAVRARAGSRQALRARSFRPRGRPTSGSRS